MTLHVALVIPDRELWSGEARTVIAKTTEGDIGVLTGHSPVFGVLAEGSLVEVLTEESSVKAAVSGTNTPSWPVNCLATNIGWDRNRSIRRARWTVTLSSSDSSSMPRMAMMSWSSV